MFPAGWSEMIKTWHGSAAVEKGRLLGSTDTDYFYFHCPHCRDTQVLQLADFKVLHDGPVEYAPEDRPGAKRDFTIAFELRCHKCGFHDFTKVSNTGWQSGKLSDSPIFG
jgi:hypothetical protein